jgi:hypothetical protein
MKIKPHWVGKIIRSESLYEFWFNAFKRTGASAEEGFRDPGRTKDPEEKRRHMQI